MCICSRMLYCMGNIIYIFERLASCCALTSVVTCIMMTLLIMLALGIGLGYNYCFVDIHTGRNKAATDDDIIGTQRPVEWHLTTSKHGSIVSQTTPSTTASSTVQALRVELNSTMVAPLNQGINFKDLIQRIRDMKRNITLELIL